MARLLIVDDEPSMLRGIEFHLQEHAEYDILTADNRNDAVKLMDSQEIDLVVSDLMLPDIRDGLGVIEAAKSQWYQPEILAMTAYESIDNAVKAMQAGADDFISKGFGLDEINLRIGNMLKKKQQMDRLAIENRILKETIQKQFSDFKIIGNSVVMQGLINKMEKVAADAKATCLIQGESGTGKDLIARAIHAMSSRNNAPFIPVNCAAIPENLIESELFGHEKGAFTSAYTSKQGKFEQASQGVIFLDEIGELPLNLQVRLLRVLEERSFYRIGGQNPIKVDVMVISATNSNLAQLVEESRFREDLYFRLNVINLRVPPLRERKSDVRPLAEFFLDKLNRDRNRNISFSEKSLQLLESYDFPGNVRELRNIIEDAFVFSEGKWITPEELSFRKLTAAKSTQPDARGGDGFKSDLTGISFREAVENFERTYFLDLLQKNFWNINEAAKQAGISREWMSKKIKRLQLKKV